MSVSRWWHGVSGGTRRFFFLFLLLCILNASSTHRGSHPEVISVGFRKFSEASKGVSRGFGGISAGLRGIQVVTGDSRRLQNGLKWFQRVPRKL